MRRIISVPTPSVSGSKRSKATAGLIRRQPKIASPTAKMRERKSFPWRPIVRIILASVTTAVCVWLLNSPLFLVRTIAVQGLRNVPEDVVRKQLPERSNVWLYPTRSVAARIKKASPLIADVGIYRGIPDAIRVVVAERTLALDWESAGKHYIIGLDGTAIEQANPPNPMLRIVDTTGLEPTLGKPVATAGFVHFAGTLSDSFSKVMSTDIDHLEIGQTTFDVTVIAKSGPKILLESTRDAEVQLKAARLVIDQFHDQIKEYVDMRVPGKAYYK